MWVLNLLTFVAFSLSFLAGLRVQEARVCRSEGICTSCWVL